MLRSSRNSLPKVNSPRVGEVKLTRIDNSSFIYCLRKSVRSLQVALSKCMNYLLYFTMKLMFWQFGSLWNRLVWPLSTNATSIFGHFYRQLIFRITNLHLHAHYFLAFKLHAMLSVNAASCQVVSEYFNGVLSEKGELVFSSTIPLSECTCSIHNGHGYCRKCTVWWLSPLSHRQVFIELFDFCLSLYNLCGRPYCVTYGVVGPEAL